MMYFALPFCGFEFDLKFGGLYCALPGIGAFWLEVEPRRYGKFLMAEVDDGTLFIRLWRLYLVADRPRNLRRPPRF